MLKRLLNNDFLRSGAIFSAANFFVSFIGYVLNLLIARNFSLSDYGEYMTAMSYAVFLGVPLSAFGMILIQRIGRAKESERVEVALSIEKWLEHELLLLMPILTGISFLLMLGMYFKGNMSLVAIVFVFVNSFVGIFSNFQGAVLQSYKSFFKVGIFSLLGAVIKLVLCLPVIYFYPNLLWLFIVFLLSGVFNYIIGRKMIRGKTTGKSVNISFEQVQRYVLRKSVLIPLLTSFGIIGLSNIDVVLVKTFFDSDTAGLYSSLSLLGKIILYIAAPLSAVAFTFFTGAESKHQSFKILLMLTGILSGLGLFATAFYAFYPGIVVNVIFGARFQSVSSIIWLAALFGTLYSLVNLYSQYFVAKNSMFAVIGILAVVIQIVGIYISHRSLYDILIMNILINGGLLIIYFFEAMRREIRYAST